MGKVHLDDFGISHTKDGIYWKTGEEENVGKLKKLDDLITQAKYHTNHNLVEKLQRKTFEQLKSLETIRYRRCVSKRSTND